MPKTKLAAKIRVRMTPREDRKSDPGKADFDKVGFLERSQGAPLTEGWCVEMVGSGHSVTTMAQMAGISNEEMFKVLCEYGLASPTMGGPHTWDVKRARGHGF